MVEDVPCPVVEAVRPLLEVGPYLQVDTGPGEQVETDPGAQVETDPGAQVESGPGAQVEIGPSCLLHPEHLHHELPDEVDQEVHL